MSIVTDHFGCPGSFQLEFEISIARQSADSSSA
jgi:hypothetical protein